MRPTGSAARPNLQREVWAETTRGHLIGEGPLQIATDAAVLGAAADSRAGRATVFALTCTRSSRRQFYGLICGNSVVYFFIIYYSIR
jgi:hypothetical protein